MSVRCALYQPDIPGNTGTLLRLGACLDVAVDVIEPTGFAMTEKALRRAGMDYVASATMTRHRNWDAFLEEVQANDRRLVLLTRHAMTAYTEFAFGPHDTLLLGRETAGVPDEVAASCAARITIPMQPELRSLNLAVAGAMAIGEALRQTGGFPASSAKAQSAGQDVTT